MTVKASKVIGMMLMALGVVGAVVFFPLRLDNGKTCLAHQYFVTESGYNGGYEVTGDEHVLARNYVIPYGLFWWISLGFVVMGLYLPGYKTSRQTKEGGDNVKTQEAFNGDRSFSVVNVLHTQGGGK